jgi:hypothetical protein
MMDMVIGRILVIGSKYSWDGDKRCTDRLHFYFELNSIMGIMPL